jgi:hypothetical protein
MAEVEHAQDLSPAAGLRSGGSISMASNSNPLDPDGAPFVDGTVASRWGLNWAPMHPSWMIQPTSGIRLTLFSAGWIAALNLSDLWQQVSLN